MSSSANLDRMDAARGGPFTYRHHGDVLAAPDPADLAFEEVMTILHHGMILPPYGEALFRCEALFNRWVAHYDLVDLRSAQRLAFSVDRYADDLQFDLHVHASMDLGEMWRSRRWRTLLATIDRLPTHSYYNEAVSKDPEHAAALAEAMVARGNEKDESGPAAPPLRTWTPEMGLLADVLDAVRDVGWAVRAAAGPKKMPPYPGSSPRPRSAMQAAMKKADYTRRKASHDALARRMLPHKQG